MAVIDSDTIDFVGHHPESDVVTLGMVGARAWGGSDERLLELEARVQNYFVHCGWSVCLNISGLCWEAD